ncbi:hypothetical protein CK203_026687 [Vitis vinifera]|uniref:DUF4283 domain-containing protein n=1 Tax=Vitis vinifera TaxID=29760 RepID=A0A438IU18_VITVI|nr:hypothetical protein CK203_026687 [Vitis vinifera]
MEWSMYQINAFISCNIPECFWEGRQILDASLITNEAINSLLKGNACGVIWWRVSGRDGEGVEVSHMLFTDDTLVFCEPSHDQLTYLYWLLMWFEAILGLKVNLEKRANSIGECGECRGADSRVWVWRYAANTRAFWQKVISGKYREEDGGWRSCEVRDGDVRPRFSRRLNDCEADMVERFFLRLQKWRLSGPLNFLVAVIWNSWVPPRPNLGGQEVGVVVEGHVLELPSMGNILFYLIQHLKVDDQTFDESHRNEESPGIQQKVQGKMLCPLDGSWLQQPRKVHKDLEFATNRKSSFLIIPEGEKGRGWENIKSTLSSMLVVPSSNAVEKGRQYRGERFSYNHVGPLHWSFVKVVSGEGPRGGGLVPVRSLGKKGVVTIVPISGGKGVFFVETTKEAFFLQDLRNLRVEGRNTVQLRRWSPKENSEIEGKFRGGWIELWGLPFHLWSEVRVRIAMKDRSVLPALIEVTDGDWVFTVSVVVVGDEDGGGRRGEKVRSTTGGRCRVREDSRMRKGEKGVWLRFFQRGHVVRVVRFHRCPGLNSNKTDDGLVGTEEAGGVQVGGEEASAVEGCRAYERKAQSLSKTGLKYAKVGCNSKGLSGLGLSLGGKNPDETVVSLRKEEDPSSGKGENNFCIS